MTISEKEKSSTEHKADFFKKSPQWFYTFHFSESVLQRGMGLSFKDTQQLLTSLILGLHWLLLVSCIISNSKI